MIHHGKMNYLTNATDEESKVITFYQLAGFKKWIKSIKDITAKEAILKRIERAELGNFGDCKSVGGGVNEMRIFIGKGYRAYFAQQNGITYWLLCGGDKSTQQTDIEKAKAIWQLLKPTFK